MNSNNPQKILYIGGFELPDKNAAAHRVIGNSKLFKELGYNTIFVSIDKQMEASISIEQTKSFCKGFCYYRVPYPNSTKEWLKYLSNINYYHLIEQIKPDIIIAYNFPALALYRLLDYCNKNSIKLIGDCTEWYSANGNIIHKIIKFLDTSLRMKLIHNKVDGLIVISNFLNNYYKKRKTVILPPLVAKNEEKWKLIYPIKKRKDEVSFVYAGNPGTGFKDKLDLIVDSIERLNKTGNKIVSLTIIGISKEQFILSFIKTPRSNIDFPYITFLGRISHAETLEVVKNSDFQIIIRENNRVNTAGFPTKFVESITCGTPVVSNIFSDINNYLFDGKNGFILDISSPEKLLKSIKKAADSTEVKINEMKKFCTDNNQFEYKKFFERTKSFFDNI